MGDGHVASLADFLVAGKSMEGLLHPELYKRNMTAADFLKALAEFDILPKRVMISIGTYDIQVRTPSASFFNSFIRILTHLKKCEVDEVFFIPPITHQTQRTSAIRAITQTTDRLWGPGQGLLYEHSSRFLVDFEGQVPEKDLFGPFFPQPIYLHMANRIREVLIPIKKKEVRTATGKIANEPEYIPPPPPSNVT